MKKALLMAALCTAVGTTANAQLPVGSVAPDFTLTDINGVSHQLYKYLDSGYAVIIDVSAAWCGPCWSAHQSHVFEDLTTHYGPNGTISPKKVKVIFIEGESTNTTAQLHGPAANTGSYATTTQGDWVTGTNYPIIDNNSQNSTYLYGGFPSFTIICRDRLVSLATAGYGSAMGAESWWLNYINADCPTTGPSATVDAKAVTYSSNSTFLCSAAPSFTFQNYGQQPITSATVKMYSGSSVVASQNWSGTLQPFAVQSVAMPTFTPTGSQTGPYSFDVTVTGDANMANNTKNLSGLNILTQGNSTMVPYSENFETGNSMPSKFIVDAEGGFFWVDGTGGSPTIKGANGQNTKCVVVNYYNASSGTVSEMLLSNYNNQNAANSSFEWDLAHAQYAASGAGSNDKLEVLVSTNCGSTWTSVWSKQGATLSTHAPVGNNAQFIPAAATDWRHEGISLNNYKSNNLFIKFKMTSDYGNFGWLDNIKVTNTTDINDVVANNGVKVYPNPAKDFATVSLDIVKATNVSVQVTDMTGRVLVNAVNENMTTGTHEVKISTAALPAGIYNVKVQTEAGSRTERLTVIK